MSSNTRFRLGTKTGSKVPWRSLGTSISNVPDFDFTVLRLCHYDYYQTAHFPDVLFVIKCSSISALAFIEYPSLGPQKENYLILCKSGLYRTFRGCLF